MNTVLTISGWQHTQIEIAPDSFERRDDILATTGSVTTIEDALDADIAANALKLVSGICKEVESARTHIKAPILEIGKKIDATAKDFVADLAAEEARLGRLLGDYQAAERAKAHRLRVEAEQEAQRLARAAEQAQLTANRAQNQPEIQQQADKAEAKAVEARVAVAIIAPVKPAGVSVRETWKYEVTDIAALFKARPDLCIIEPNTAAIRAQTPYNQAIPGIRCWKEAKASVR